MPEMMTTGGSMTRSGQDQRGAGGRSGRRRSRRVLLAGAIALLVGCDSTPTEENRWPDPEPGEPAPTKEIAWPLANSESEDADSVHAPFGPRALPSGYDFHAGVDLPASTGTRTNAVLPGRVVLVSHWDGSSTGPGNAVLVAHSEERFTSYLHLESISVAEGDSVEAGEKVGTVGGTGASYPHLHLGYFVGLSRDTRVRDERKSRNPLEILPHGDPEGITVAFDADSVTLDLPLQRMTIVALELSGQGESRTVDYYDVVALGSSARDERVQGGVHLTAGRPSGGRFDLTLRPSPESFVPDRVVAVDIRGDTLLDARRP